MLELIDTTLPSIYPEGFPFSEQFSWLESSRYYVTNQLKLLNDRQKIETDYKRATANIKNEIERNQIKFQFLHDLITETDNPLVKSVEKFFLWLGFENIINLDETNPEIKEEDLQISLQNELLVIEIKGIGGTSKDYECSQISKIKYRRSEERKKFDVYALYIVNHQRHFPPHERKNPPFTENKISDARLDKRGLLTTYDLFNLYSNIEQDFISKADARLSILQYGLVKFIPSNAVLLGFPLEAHHKGQVVILIINELEIRKDMSIIVCDKSNWYKVNIIEIKLNNIPVDIISDGEVGIKLSKSVSKNSELWLANT